MSEKRAVKLGETVILIPSLSSSDANLRANGATEVAAIVTAVHGPHTASMRYFVNDHVLPGCKSSVQHQSEAVPGQLCFRYQDEDAKLKETDPRLDPPIGSVDEANVNANTAPVEAGKTVITNEPNGSHGMDLNNKNVVVDAPGDFKPLEPAETENKEIIPPADVVSDSNLNTNTGTNTGTNKSKKS